MREADKKGHADGGKDGCEFGSVRIGCITGVRVYSLGFVGPTKMECGFGVFYSKVSSRYSSSWYCWCLEAESVGVEGSGEGVSWQHVVDALRALFEGPTLSACACYPFGWGSLGERY